MAKNITITVEIHIKNIRIDSSTSRGGTWSKVSRPQLVVDLQDINILLFIYKTKQQITVRRFQLYSLFPSFHAKT